MPRGVVDLDGLRSPEAEALRRAAPPPGLPFAVRKLGHVVLKVKDLQRSLDFYVGLLGFRVSDVYPDTMMKGGMVFLRCNTDHHCLALVGGAKEEGAARELHHLAFELATLEELVRARDHLRRHGVPDRGGIPRSGQPLSRALLGPRPGRQRPPRTPAGGVARGGFARGRDRPSAARPGHHASRSMSRFLCRRSQLPAGRIPSGS